MSYEITARISGDLKTSLPISKEDWKTCSILKNIEFKEKNSYPNYFLEVQYEPSNEFIPCFWISDDFKTAVIDSKVLFINKDFEKYVLSIASKLKAIVFGQEGELYYIPCIGKIEPDKNLLDQIERNIMKLKENSVDINSKIEVLEYINTKANKRASS